MYGTKEDPPFECPTGGSDTKSRPFPSNGPNYKSYFDGPNIHFDGPNIQARATKIATRLDYGYLVNIITSRQDKIRS